MLQEILKNMKCETGLLLLFFFFLEISLGYTEAQQLRLSLDTDMQLLGRCEVVVPAWISAEPTSEKKRGY